MTDRRTGGPMDGYEQNPSNAR